MALERGLEVGKEEVADGAVAAESPRPPYPQGHDLAEARLALVIGVLDRVGHLNADDFLGWFPCKQKPRRRITHRRSPMDGPWAGL